MAELSREYGSAKDDFHDLRMKESEIIEVAAPFTYNGEKLILKTGLILGDNYIAGNSFSFLRMRIIKETNALES